MRLKADDARDEHIDAVEEKLNLKLQLEVAGKEEIDRITNIKSKSSLLLSESGKLLTVEEKGVGDVGVQVTLTATQLTIHLSVM